ncbi:hypothetical protein [Candidatus Thiodictyon syntrophicum]|jgi:hypothetical protein|uniref:Uncharacterized protein n=1 Tax=Candidatus Thiodictyon syntrophicum TaxID=1166950 RepID=A0A2K8UEM9_9GAMM|nr:hypothetical protein [Candidatus Thiodictyon syntrophicum]AUB83919.1 hypothetical protein THSYN_25295 [Candidatus Thiodictyon syntrophicum]
MHRPVLATAFLTLLLSGCGSFLPGHIGGIVTYVSPDDYAERLCAHVDLESYPSCVSHVLDYFEEPKAEDIPVTEVTSGPFAVAMDNQLYLGTYQGGLFRSNFRVTSGHKACRGAYSAYTGSRDAIYDVYCNDGRAGWAATIRDQSGSNGIGQLTLSDGTKGEIIFGYAALGRARPYPWGDVWRPRPGQTGPAPRSAFEVD